MRMPSFTLRRQTMAQDARPWYKRAVSIEMAHVGLHDDSDVRVVAGEESDDVILYIDNVSFSLVVVDEDESRASKLERVGRVVARALDALRNDPDYDWRNHVIERARELGHTALLPSEWNATDG
jgi:hypothetical protein